MILLRYFVDRIEENFAVCEDQSTGEMVDINLENIPFIVNEGDVIIYEDDKWNKEDFDKERHERIKDKMNDLWN